MMNFHTLKIIKKWANDLPVGGTWGRTLDQITQKNLRWFWFDGLFASASDNIMINFISLYILSLGATEAQIGLMSSFSNIAGALLLFPGALLAEKFTHRKWFTWACGASGRLAILLLVFVPILVKGSAAVWVAIALSLLRDSANNFGYPAWMSVTNEIVPIEGRGRFFGSRNFVMNTTGMIATLLAGKIITLLVTPLGYQIALGAAFVLGISSTFSYAHINDPAIIQNDLERGFSSIKHLLRRLKDYPQFIALTLTAAIWNFSVNISGPFFSVYMVKSLNFTAESVGFLAVVTSITTLATQNQIGNLADRISNRKMQLISMFFIPLLPLAWLFATKVWHIALINAFSGIVWGIFNLVSFNLLLSFIPKDQVPRFSAIYQIVVLTSLALGALVGSAIVTKWGFFVVCICSAAGRYISAFLFGWKVKDTNPTKDLVDLR